MRKFLSILFLLPLFVLGQTTVNYTLKDTLGIDTVLRPGCGLNEFGTTHFIDYPFPGVTNNHPLDLYQRWKFCEIMTGFNTFNFSDVDAKFNNAIDRGQMIGIGFEPISDYATCNTVGGATLSYPVYLHNQMQAESVKDWIGTDGNQWVPNWNSTNWKTAWDYLIRRIRGHLDSTSHSGKRYIDVLLFIDSREFGNYGEDHTYGAGHGQTIPTGAKATDATLKALFNSVRTYFPDKPIIVNINALYGDYSDSDVPSSYGYFLLTEANSKGRFGIRVDHVGNPGPYTAKDYTQNTTTFNGLSFKTEIANRWKENFFLGEPEQSGYQQAGQCDYSFAATYVNTFHLSMIENANIVTASSPCVQSGFRSYAKRMGYRYSFTKSNISDSLVQNGTFTVPLIVQNTGIAPTYERWNWVYQLKQGATLIQEFNSSLQLQYYLPGTSTQTDNFPLPANLGGNHALGYELYLIVRDPNGNRAPMPLQNTGRFANGTYLLRTNLHIATQGQPPPPPPPPPVNNPPVVLMGADQTDSLPKNTDTLTAQISDPDGDIVSYTWSQTSGPNTATIVTATGSVNTSSGPQAVSTRITGLIEGTYQFRLMVSDGKGGNASGFVNVFVFNVTPPPPPPPPPPVYKAPTIDAGDTIQTWLPKDSVTLTGHVLTKDTAIQSVLWTRIRGSGTTTGTIVTPTDSTTIVRGLSKGYYLYKYTVTDKAGNIVEDFVYVFVNDSTLPQPDPIPLPTGPNKNRIFGIKTE